MLQINTIGVSTLMYWIPIYIIDILIYTITVLILTAFFLIIYNEEIFLVTDIGNIIFFILYFTNIISLIFVQIFLFNNIFQFKYFIFFCSTVPVRSHSTIVYNYLQRNNKMFI